MVRMRRVAKVLGSADFADQYRQLSRQPQEGRQGSLRAGIRRVSDGLVDGHPKGTGVMFPMGNDVARVVRLPAEEAVLLNSREKAPYLVFLEVIHADDDDIAPWPRGRSPSQWP